MCAPFSSCKINRSPLGLRPQALTLEGLFGWNGPILDSIDFISLPFISAALASIHFVHSICVFPMVGIVKALSSALSSTLPTFPELSPNWPPKYASETEACPVSSWFRDSAFQTSLAPHPVLVLTPRHLRLHGPILMCTLGVMDPLIKALFFR